jgi:hypothetical protein
MIRDFIIYPNFVNSRRVIPTAGALRAMPGFVGVRFSGSAG